MIFGDQKYKQNYILFFIPAIGYSHAYPFVAMGCVGYGIGFPSVLNESVSSLKTDHKIAVQPMQACMGHVSATLDAGSYPDLPSTLKEQEPLFETVMKSFFMLPFQQDNVQLYCKLIVRPCF